MNGSLSFIDKGTVTFFWWNCERFFFSGFDIIWFDFIWGFGNVLHNLQLNKNLKSS